MSGSYFWLASVAISNLAPFALEGGAGRRGWEVGAGEWVCVCGQYQG